MIVTTVLWLVCFRTEPIEFLVLRAEINGIESTAYKEAIKAIQVKHEPESTVAKYEEIA